MELEGWGDSTALRRAALLPIAVLWHGPEGERFADQVGRITALRRGLLERTLELGKGSRAALKVLEEAPRQQIADLRRYFQPGGDWEPVIETLGEGAEREDFRLRMDRLRAQVETPPRLGFIGSERGYERLAGISEIFWLRESEAEAQIDLFSLEIIVVETVPTSGLNKEDADWLLAFSALDGSLPERGARLFEAAEAAGIPVHLWATGAPEIAPLWREAARRADRVLAEVIGSEGQDWAPIAPDVLLPCTTEPTACSVARQSPPPADLMLVPTASDICQYPDFAEFVDTPGLYATLLTEFRYRFTPLILSQRLSQTDPQIYGEHTRAEERALLVSARIVLLPSRSLRPDAELVQIAVDAIASGAIPVLWGMPRTAAPQLEMLDRVFSPTDLMELQAAYRVTWVRERRWRALYRQVMRDCVWTGTHREALLGRDPCGPKFDRPHTSVVLVTKRPHLLHHCLETFRAQSWDNKELILIFNTGEIPEDLPELAENERAFALPEAANIGECLNRGITQAKGRYWCKLDDDDFYSTTYLEETVYYYRSAQADVVGRRSVYFYFAGEDATYSREKFAERCGSLMTTGSLAGAALSMDRRSKEVPFSVMDRNSADTHWLLQLHHKEIRVYSADCTSMIVYRSADETTHSWRLSADSKKMEQFRRRTTGNIFELPVAERLTGDLSSEMSGGAEAMQQRLEAFRHLSEAVEMAQL
ncbi:glycosyltransferase family A protein [Histidinibacterium aquaticum]|uniref:glycosyltransferase family A protein n=1 Tax=Histidinibacterium aquaticum TaxID=2613962 RepID=UPI00168B542B|nr:glycosyltransferase family A protein [Histidinibacterium aquaticum]